MHAVAGTSMITSEIYKLGWELVCGPNFGGNSVDWPCFVFKRLKSKAAQLPLAPLAFGAIKDQNMPGKFCLSTTASHTFKMSQKPLVKHCEGLKATKG